MEKVEKEKEILNRYKISVCGACIHIITYGTSTPEEEACARRQIKQWEDFLLTPDPSTGKGGWWVDKKPCEGCGDPTEGNRFGATATRYLEPEPSQGNPLGDVPDRWDHLLALIALYGGERFAAGWRARSSGGMVKVDSREGIEHNDLMLKIVREVIRLSES